MRIYVLALAILVFSGVATMFNTLGIFDYKVYEPGYNISQSEIQDIYVVDESAVDTKEGILDRLSDAVGFSAIIKIMRVIKNALSLALNLGSLFEQYVPGTVGQQFGTLITTLTWFIYAWGGVQLWRKVSTKGMD